MIDTYEYKVSTLGRRVKVETDDTGATLYDRRGCVLADLEFEEATRAYYVSMSGEHAARILRVESPRGEFVLQQDSGDVSPRSHDALDHTEAMRSVLAGLERCAPDLKIEHGFGGVGDAMIEWSLKLTIVFMIALPIAAVLTGESLDRVIGALFIGAFGVWMGVGMWRVSKWPERDNSMTPRELRRKLGDPRFPDE